MRIIKYNIIVCRECQSQSVNNLSIVTKIITPLIKQRKNDVLIVLKYVVGCLYKSLVRSMTPTTYCLNKPITFTPHSSHLNIQAFPAILSIIQCLHVIYHSIQFVFGTGYL